MTRFITCRDNQTVADASYRQRINIPLDCRDGACGTCKALCESGNYDGGTYIDDALPPDEAAAGYVLPCSMKPRSDLVLQIASTSDVAKTQAATYTGTVTQLDRLSATTVAIGVEIPNRSELAFLPGQYVNFTVPGTDQKRSYSFSNAPDDERLTFLVKLTPGGAMSEYLAQRASVGDTISFTGPNGSFFLRETDRPVLLLAGGTGLAPVLSILRTMRDASSQRKAHLIYGVSTDEDLVALDQIEEIASVLRGFTWDHCVSDPLARRQQGLRHKPHQAGAPLRRRCRGVSLRAAPDGRGGTHPRHQSRHRANGLLLREVRAGPRRRPHRAVSWRPVPQPPRAGAAGLRGCPRDRRATVLPRRDLAAYGTRGQQVDDGGSDPVHRRPADAPGLSARHAL